MDPELMKMAMESMSKMTPQQMTDMQRQMAQLQPDFLRSQMAAMQNIPPDVLRQRMAAASTLDPSQMQAQFSQAATAARQQEEHQIRCSNQLKEEGNRLFGAQRTDEAIEKYRRAKDNLKDLTSSSARDVRLKCALNLASCHLRLGEHADAVRECSEVLEAQPGDRKALYRRGQAHLALQEYGSAVTDLQKALVSATDADRDVIKEKLAKAEEGLAAEGDASKAAGALPDAQKAESSKAGAEVVEEDGAVSEVAPIVEPIQANYAQPPPREPMQPSFPAGFPGSMPSFPANSGMPNLDPRMMREMMGMIRKNPGMMESMLSAVTPEQLQAAAQMNGGLPPGVDLSPEVMRSMANSMAAMPQEQMDSMLAAVDASRAPAPSSVSGSTPADETAGPSVGFPAGPGSSQADLAAAAMQMNPEMMSQAMDMFTKMDPDVLANMARSMGGAPGPGTQASAGLDMPQNAAAMQQMLNNPQAVKMMHSMMSSMSPEQLAAMSKASGHELSPEQAEVMASKMQNMSEQQVQQLLKAASWLQRAVDLARKARDVTLANKLFVLGVVVLLLALLLRRMGIV